jgi:hypothetical protein
MRYWVLQGEAMAAGEGPARTGSRKQGLLGLTRVCVSGNLSGGVSLESSNCREAARSR